MTIRMTYAPRRLAIPAASIAAMLLAGCSSGNIGESWQCPLAETGSCDSVAAADPAVPDMGAARKAVLTGPLWRQRGGAPGKPAAAPCEAECGGSFDPFGWLMRLFQAEAHEGEARPDAGPLPGAEAAAPAPLPAEAGPSRTETAQDGPAAGELRSGEIVARIWIAPFVDANGVYREASHVRVVLKPAGWRLP